MENDSDEPPEEIDPIFGAAHHNGKLMDRWALCPYCHIGVIQFRDLLIWIAEFLIPVILAFLIGMWWAK
jgi:hypothetical protein